MIARPVSMTMQLSPIEAPSAPRQVGVDVAICTLAPTKTARCYVNGSPVFRMTKGQIGHYKKLMKRDRTSAAAYLSKAANEARNWKMVHTRPGDVIEWRDEPGDKEDFRVILQIAAVVVTIATYGTTSAWLGAAFAAVNVAYNLLVPPTVAEQAKEDAPNEVYTASLSGNTARLDQPIWKNCGLNPITPPFAAEPYLEMVDSGKRDAADRPIDYDQLYKVLFCVGLGNHAIKAVYIGKTPLFNFNDVLVSRYLAPGEAPLDVLANVTNSVEVSGGLDMLEAEYVGAYVACAPKRRVRKIGIDVAAPAGLGVSPTGDFTISWQIEYQEIDDYGRQVGPWAILGNETRTLNTNTPQRWSNIYDLPSDMRVQIRTVRTSPKETDITVRNEMTWAGMRAYLADPAPLNPDAAHYEIVMRASKQLNSQSQRDFRMFVQGMCRTWDPVDGWSDDEVETRNPAWWLADLKLNAVWGEGRPENTLDLQGIYDFAQKCDARQDRFDYTFTTRTSAAAAAQLIARAGRARVFQHYGVDTLARDEAVTLPVTAFTHRNATDMRMSESTPQLDYADGVVIEYDSNYTYKKEFIECPAPGFTVSDTLSPRYNPALPIMSRPIYRPLVGIRGAMHAEREGLYEAAVMLLRTRNVSCKVEMQAILCAYMSTVRWLPEIAGYGQTGDVAKWDGNTLVTLSQKADFSKGATYLTLVRDDGSLTTPALVSPGPTPYDVVLASPPDFDLVVNAADRERPKFLLGTLADCDELVKVTSIGKSEDAAAQDNDAPGARLYEINAVVDDLRIHQVDNFLLPGPGDVQDPIFFPDEPSGGGIVVFVRLLTHTVTDGNHPTGDGGGGGVDGAPGIELRNDGSLWTHSPGNDPSSSPFVHANEWLLHGPFTSTVCSDFEVLATIDYGAIFGDDSIGSWLNLGTTRFWYGGGLYTTTALRLKIRRVGDTAIQAENVMYLHSN